VCARSLTKPFFRPSQPGSCAWLSPFLLWAKEKKRVNSPINVGGGTALLHTSVAAGLKFDRVSVEFELELSNRNDILIRDNLLQTTPK